MSVSNFALIHYMEQNFPRLDLTDASQEKLGRIVEYIKGLKVEVWCEKGMKKQLVIIGIVAILVTVGLSGCNQVSNPLNPERNRFTGTWKVRRLLRDTQMMLVLHFYQMGLLLVVLP